MDQLVQLAKAGNVNGLFRLIQSDPYILERMDGVPFIDTPLHIAAKEGKTQFCTEIMNLKPSFARKLNPEGLSPLHLALENRHVKTVQWFIDEDPSLVRAKGKHGLTPLHCLVDKMENIGVDLLEEFIGACPESIIDRTGCQETALHLAVKSQNLEAVKAFLGRISELGEEKILNWKDEHGKTALHLAAEAPQTQVVRLFREHICWLTEDDIQTALEMLESRQCPEINVKTVGVSTGFEA